MCQSSKISRRHPSKMQQSTRISVISPEQCNMLGRTKLVIPDFAALLVVLTCLYQILQHKRKTHLSIFPRMVLETEMQLTSASTLRN